MSDDEMTDGELFREWDKAKQAKRAGNRNSSAKMLSDAGINYEAKNGGAHLIVSCQDGIIDFWPGTGKFITRQWKGGYSITGRGVRRVIGLAKPKL